MNLLQIETFLEVARARSFAAASRRMSLPTSTVSARIKAMEERIGVTLFRRTTRKVALTSDGQHFFNVYTEAFEILSSLETKNTQGGELSGHIRLTMPIDFPMSHLADVLDRFSARHPAVTFDIVVTDEVLDFVEDNIDLALRGGAPGAENLICRKFAAEPLGLFASPEYFETHSEKLRQGDLEGCALFDPLGQAHTLGRRANGTLRPTVQTTNKELCKAMAIQSCGIALLGRSFCRNEVQSGELIALPGGMNIPDLPMYLVMPSKRLVPQRVRSFVDHLVGEQRSERQN